MKISFSAGSSCWTNVHRDGAFQFLLLRGSRTAIRGSGRRRWKISCIDFPSSTQSEADKKNNRLMQTCLPLAHKNVIDPNLRYNHQQARATNRTPWRHRNTSRRTRKWALIMRSYHTVEESENEMVRTPEAYKGDKILLSSLFLTEHILLPGLIPAVKGTLLVILAISGHIRGKPSNGSPCTMRAIREYPFQKRKKIPMRHYPAWQSKVERGKCNVTAPCYESDCLPLRSQSLNSNHMWLCLKLITCKW